MKNKPTAEYPKPVRIMLAIILRVFGQIPKVTEIPRGQEPAWVQDFLDEEEEE